MELEGQRRDNYLITSSINEDIDVRDRTDQTKIGIYVCKEDLLGCAKNSKQTRKLTSDSDIQKDTVKIDSLVHNGRPTLEANTVCSDL